MASVIIRHLSFTYNGKNEPTLRDISLTINSGEIIVISGNNGCGKSTLSACITDIIPTITPGKLEGEIYLNEALLVHGKGTELIGAALQDSDVFLMEKVYDELAFPLRSFQVTGVELEQRIMEIAGLMGLQDLLERKIISLSGGERQKVAIAAALMCDSPILLFDEPIEQLDPASAVYMGDLFKKLAEEGKTILVCLHNPLRASNWCTRNIVLSDSRIIYDGYLKKEELPENGVRIGNDLKRGATPVLELQNLTYHYDGGGGIEDITLQINKQEIFAIMGPNGAGKSTLIQHVMGLLKPQSGRVLVKGMNIAGIPSWKLAREIGILFQNPDDQIFNSRVDEEIAWNLVIRGIPKHKAIECAHKFIADFGLEYIASRHPHDLNRSLRQWVALASVLITKPEILILDEPTKMMDAVFQAKVTEWLLNYRDQGGTILFVTHDSEFVRRYADRTGIIDKGRLIDIM